MAMKKTTFLFTALLAVAIMGGCSKDADTDLTRPGCETYDQGDISVHNSRGDIFRIDLNGSSQGNVAAYQTKYLDNLGVGTYTVRATQVTGWTLWPDVVSNTVTVTQCQTTYVVF